MITIIKWLLGVLLVLFLIGGAIEFQSNDTTWSLIMNKETVFSSVQNGSIKIYDFFADMIR